MPAPIATQTMARMVVLVIAAEAAFVWRGRHGDGALCGLPRMVIAAGVAVPFVDAVVTRRQMGMRTGGGSFVVGLKGGRVGVESGAGRRRGNCAVGAAMVVLRWMVDRLTDSSSGAGGAGSTSRTSRALGLVVVVRVALLLLSHSPAGVNPRSAGPVSAVLGVSVPYFSGPLTGKGDREGGEENALMHCGYCGVASVRRYRKTKQRHHWTVSGRAKAKQKWQRAGRGKESRAVFPVV